MYPTEVQADIKTFYEDKSKTRSTTMLVVARWQMVGGGTSPYKGNWARRLSKQCNPSNWHEGGPLSNIKTIFENQPETKSDSILDAREAWRPARRYII